MLYTQRNLDLPFLFYDIFSKVLSITTYSTQQRRRILLF